MEALRLPQRLAIARNNLPTKVVFTYILDYVIILVLILGFYALDAVEPYHQHFSLQNYSIQYPYAVKERITINFAVTLDAVIPAIIIAVYCLVIDGIFSHQSAPDRRGKNKYTLKERLWELNCGVLGLALSQGLAFVITGALKNATGKPRPDLIDRCSPTPGSKDLPVFGLSNSSICEQKNHAILKDGFRSFPSGHSSSAFAGLFYLSLYLAGKLHVLDKRGEVWKSFIVMIPTLGAALIAVSRIMDARHHPFDVISGSLLGMMMAYGAYRQYFPRLSESWRKGRAYPIRSWGSEPRSPRPEERQVSRDQGVEPLRPNSARIDEEQPGSTFTAPRVLARQPSYAEAGDNVFRNQISRSQRLRQREFSHPLGPSESSTESDAHIAPPSFSRLNKRRKRQMNSDGYGSSSSDHGLDENGFNMRPIRRSTAPVIQESDTHPAHRLGAKDFEQDTSYHPHIPGPRDGPQPAHPLVRVEDTSVTASLDHPAAPLTEAGGVFPQPVNPAGGQSSETYRS